MNIKKSSNVIDLMRDFLKLESASGMVLIGATVVALVMANIPTALKAYDWFLSLHLTVTIGGLGVDKPLLLWINDALMVFFFMLVGLELKGEETAANGDCVHVGRLRCGTITSATRSPILKKNVALFMLRDGRRAPVDGTIPSDRIRHVLERVTSFAAACLSTSVVAPGTSSRWAIVSPRC